MKWDRPAVGPYLAIAPSKNREGRSGFGQESAIADDVARRAEPAMWGG
jgi:hypothetical protein